MQKAIALTAFVHGTLNLKRGESAEFSVGTFEELKKAGLVTDAAAPLAGQAAAAASTSLQKPVAPRAPRTPRVPSDKSAPPLDNKSEVGSSLDNASTSPNAGADSAAVGSATDPATLTKAEGDANSAADAADLQQPPATAVTSQDAPADA